MINKNLYLIIAFLALLNVAVISYILGSRGSFYGGRGYHEKHHEEHKKEMFELMKEYVEDSDNGEVTHKSVDYDKPVAETHGSSYDFGAVSKRGGIVSTTFKIENHGKQPLEIGEIATSCGCTSAEIDKKTLGFDEEATLTVYFDPNFHEEPEGVFTRSVFVETNDKELPEMQFDIFIEVTD